MKEDARELDPRRSGLYLRYQLMVAYLLDKRQVPLDELDGAAALRRNRGAARGPGGWWCATRRPAPPGDSSSRMTDAGGITEAIAGAADGSSAEFAEAGTGRRRGSS